TKGGLSRALELTGLSGVRAWSRICIVVAFASIVVFARLLDRLHVVVSRRTRGRASKRRQIWTSVLVGVVLLGALDQASPALMPNAEAAARARVWRRDDAFVKALQRRLPRNAMVFELPVVDFPEHSAVNRLPPLDLIKEG